MAKSNNLENVAADFIGRLCCPMNKSDAEGVVMERVFGAMTETESELLFEEAEQLLGNDDDLSKLQKFKLADMFAKVTGRVGLEDSVASYISVNETDTNTVQELEEAGFSSFARLIKVARTRNEL